MRKEGPAHMSCAFPPPPTPEDCPGLHKNGSWASPGKQATKHWASMFLPPDTNPEPLLRLLLMEIRTRCWASSSIALCHIVLRQHLSLNLNFSLSARLTGQGSPGVCPLCSPMQWLQTHAATSNVHMGAGDPDSGPHTCRGNSHLEPFGIY